MLIENITMDEYKKGLKQTRTMIIPFGTVEVHGNHLPLSTDTLIAHEILKIIQKKRKIFIAPPIHYGVCTSTKQHPGTITISPQTLRLLTSDIVRDANKKGIKNFLLVSGHGGSLHINALKEVSEELVDEIEGIKIAVLTPYDFLYKKITEIAETENDSHAGEIETSIVLSLRPDLVKGTSDEEYPDLPRPFIVKDRFKYWPGGVWGNPQKATKDKGDKIIGLIVDNMLNIIDNVESI